MVVVASNTESHLYFIELSLDGVGVRGVVTDLSKYPVNCNRVLEMFTLSGTLFISHNHGISAIDLELERIPFFCPMDLHLAQRYKALPLSVTKEILHLLTWVANKLRFLRLPRQTKKSW